jgi:hypothetical protein
MRTGICLSVTFADRARLRALVKDRNASQKHVWRAQIVLLTAEALGTSAIMRDTGKSKTCVWRWQERFADEGFESLLRDKTRPSRISKLDPSIAEPVKRRLELGVFRSVADLQATINRFLDNHNPIPNPSNGSPIQTKLSPPSTRASSVRFDPLAGQSPTAENGITEMRGVIGCRLCNVAL